ncbi:DUF1684 domain-containing protein [Corynebacterium pacaense]|uniref:DUF1684 domain-containing protein n=1 Tax=Corynebacterium pacaense TaxID=1816684 RepID=UPI0009BA04C9|nr:DUF1684 domain-containing protein [Corynebacterium pacaense]
MTFEVAAVDPGLLEDWESWRRDKEAGRRSPTGFFAVTGLYWLSDLPVEVPGLPGTWSATADVVSADLGTAELVDGEGHTLSGVTELTGIGERGSILLSVRGDDSRGHDVTTVEVARRGGRFILRPKAESHPFLSEYLGTDTFAHDPRWRITASFTPFGVPRPVTVNAAVEGIEHVYRAPGQVVFSIDGVEHTLLAFDGHAPGELLVLFRDGTSGHSTYQALRALGLHGGPDAGEIVLDFNYAANLPCAYTDLATCPLPPAGNEVSVDITAGEKTPRQRVHARADGPGTTWDQIVSS